MGTCAAGTQQCTDDGLGFTPCVGQVLPDTESCADPVDTNCDGVSPTCPSWTTIGVSSGNAGGAALVTTPGGVVVSGYFAGTMTLGGFQLTSNGGFDHFVAALDNTGQPIWATSWGSIEYDYSSHVAALPSGDIVVATGYRGPMQVGAKPVDFGGDHDVVVVLLSGATGQVQAVKAFPAPDFQGITNVGVSATGEIILLCAQEGTVDWGGGPLVVQGSREVSIRLDQDLSFVSATVLGNIDAVSTNGAFGAGGMAIVSSLQGTDDWGTGPLVSNGSMDALTVRYDDSGAALWGRHDGDAGLQEGTAAAIDAAGGVLAAGHYTGTFDLGNGTPVLSSGWAGYVARFDANGAATWVTSFESSNFTDVYGLADAQGDTIVVGEAHGLLTVGALTLDLSGGGIQAFAARLDATGAPIWLKAVAGGGVSTAYEVVVASNGAVFMTGTSDAGAWIELTSY
ncbi:MAG: hypothetical protein WKG00_21750 [Polyangiaceae bacterium]